MCLIRCEARDFDDVTRILIFKDLESLLVFPVFMGSALVQQGLPDWQGHFLPRASAYRVL